MNPEPIVTYPDPILTTPTQKFDFNNPPMDPTEIAMKLMVTMNSHMGVGLAANQIGIPYSVLSIRGYPDNYVCFNPKIVYASPEEETMEEACISFPKIKNPVKVKRPKEIRVRFQTPSGLTETKMFQGLTARILQHEIDHLNGQVFVNRANRYHREKAMKGYYK